MEKIEVQSIEEIGIRVLGIGYWVLGIWYLDDFVYSPSFEIFATYTCPPYTFYFLPNT